MQESLPPQAWTWINEHLWGNLAGPIQWSSLLVVFILSVLAAVWAQRLLQQRIRVTELAAGPTKVTLSDASSSYFDEYLDEIVYFFQTSNTSVVIFEDLDRFKDPYIFETLRELNMLLNNAEQTGPSPIRFVYAIRDSIFEQLDTTSTGGPDGTEGNEGSANEGEVRRLTSTNRTKFFDLVVPMVPFISHRTSRDLIRQELDAVVPHQRPGDAVVDIVGAHLTDMRLIKNICNEYEVFRRRILSGSGLDELSADRLFASIVYKNLYLVDYEKIRDGTSRLDTLYRAYRGWVAQQTAAARRAERAARARLRRVDGIASRSASLGARLQEVLLARTQLDIGASAIQVKAADSNFSFADLETPEFWRAYIGGRGELTVHYRQHYQPESAKLSFEKVQAIMGYPLTPEDWTEEVRTDISGEIATAIANRRIAQHASMTDAFAETDRVFLYRGVNQSITDVAAELFEGADVVLELLRAGLIDENFTLYITQFPGQAISASAMNFIIKAVQPDSMDIEYHFGADDEVDTTDILAVLNAEEVRLLGGQSVYNIELFDYLLKEDPNKLDEPIRRLAAAADSDRTFIDAYLASGNLANELARSLSACWSGIFNYLLAQDGGTRDEGLLDAALGGVEPDLTYSLGNQQRAVLSATLPQLSTITAAQSADRAGAIAATLEQMGIRVEELGGVAEPLRAELASRSLYPVTLPNLLALFDDNEHLPLDRIKSSKEGDVYQHVLAHLPDYLAALDETTGVPAVADAEQFTDVLADAGKANIDVTEDVARRANAECMVEDLDLIEKPLWPAVVRAHRLVLTARNTAAYIAEYGVDLDLAEWLRIVGTVITVPAGDSTPLDSLALNLLNAASPLGDDATLRHVESLELGPGSIAAADLQKRAHTMLPALVEKGIVVDDAEAYTSLEDDEWAIKENLIRVASGFPGYMTDLPFSTNELFWIAASRLVPDTVKDTLLTEFGTFEPKLGPKGAKAIADWAISRGRTPTPEVTVALAAEGGAATARPILELLGNQASTMDLALLKEALNALGKPYSQLTSPGWDRPKVDMNTGVAAVLGRLKEANIVSKFEENHKKGVFEVSKRHS
ncbi:hypothetical protein C5O27_00350 [Gordonia alkanivorans]|nr:hypothetical protein C5O27_00350 [Gordonia alkanivorans]